MVFAWHFTHAGNGSIVPFEYLPAFFPLALLDEGHTGVALFMTLSGYLFAKLLNGKQIDFKAFIWNRVLRLLPLLVLIIMMVGAIKFFRQEGIRAYITYAYSIVQGVLYPSLPNGGWSITAEFHYYIILPFFLWMLRKSKWWPVSILLAAMILRLYIYHVKGQVQAVAYYTIIGRIDQFVLGMLIYHFRERITRNHVFALGTITAFILFYWYFDLRGGFFKNPSYPSTNPIWIFFTTLEGFSYAVAIAWYESSFCHPTTGISKLIGRMGEYSYSIYLFHFFIVFDAARFVNTHLMKISNFYWACIWAFLAFIVIMMPIGYLSFRFIEAPFLRKRKAYILGTRAPSMPASPNC